MSDSSQRRPPQSSYLWGRRPATSPSKSSTTSVASRVGFRVMSFLAGPNSSRRMEMAKVYVLKLTAEERRDLESVVKRGRAAAWKVQRAQALLKCDQGAAGPGWTDAQVAEAFG